MNRDEETLAALEQERDQLQRHIYRFVEGLHATWERPVDPTTWPEDFDALLSDWIAGQAQDLGALRERIHRLRSLLLALDDRP